MDPVSPVVAGNEARERIYGADQPEYLTLPVLPIGRALVSRWRLTPEERVRIAGGADLFVAILGNSMPPILPLVDSPDETAKIVSAL